MIKNPKDKPLGTRLKKWIMGWIRMEPHFYIGGIEDPYLIRWYVLPRNKIFNIYLHKFMRDDEDSALHDHPWWFWSWMIKGTYYEMVPDPHSDKDFGSYIVLDRKRWSLAYRPAEHRHRVILKRDMQKNLLPCWTIVATGPVSRKWGFWCPKGFVHWEKFVELDEKSSVAKGCGEMV